MLRVVPSLSRQLDLPTPAHAEIAHNADNAVTDDDTNVVIFLIDTLQARRLNCYGYDKKTTSPNIDALARKGVLFKNAYAAAPWTLPSVASLLTSRFPCEHGVLSTRTRFGSRMRTLPMCLKHIGYTTLGLWGNAIVGPGLGFDRGYDFYRESFTNSGKQVRAARQRYSGRPFFLYVHNIEPHNPEFFAPPSTPGFRDVAAPIRARIAEHYKQYRIATWLDFGQKRRPGTTNVEAIQQKHVNGLVELRDVYSELYDACVRLADKRVGSAIRALKDREEWNDTLFILLSDHGEEMFEHGGWSHDQSVYEELLHVPLIIRFPENEFAGKRVHDLVSLVDVMPTVLDYVGKPDLVADLRGRSLLPLIRGDLMPPPDEFRVTAMRHNVMSYYEPWQRQRGNINVVVRRGEWKGIWNVELDTFELYDLEADPGEHHDISARHAKLVSDMRDYARAWYADCGQNRTYGRRAVKGAGLSDDARDNLRALGYID